MQTYETGQGNYEVVFYDKNKTIKHLAMSLRHAKEEAIFMLNWFCAKRIFIYDGNLIYCVR